MTTDLSFALGTFSIAGGPPFGGLWVDERVVALRALTPAGAQDGLEVGLAGDSVEAVLDGWEHNLPRLASAARFIRERGAEQSVHVDTLRVHAPLQPRRLFCTGANYRGHVGGLIRGDSAMRRGQPRGAPGPAAEETPAQQAARVEAELERRAKTGKPYIFVKLTSSVIGPCDTLVLPRDVEKPDWELELAVVIGKTCRRVSAARAMDYVAGYTIHNDVTARDLVFPAEGGGIGADWLASKCQLGFAPLGPKLVPARFVPDVYDLELRLSVNGRVMQDERTRDMLIDVARQIEHLSNILTLLPGDVISTGSPAGNGSMHGVFLKPGDVMEGSITGLGTQRIVCVSEH